MSDAFAGLKLSEAATLAPTSVDQRLFVPPPNSIVTPSGPPVRSQPPKSPAANKNEPVVRVHGQVVAEKIVAVETKPDIPLDSARSERPLSEPTAKTVAPFDINEKPWRKDSFLFTDSEFDRLEDLKLELRRRFDLPATKNDIARCALQGLYEDYARDPEKGRIVRYLRAKQR